MAVFRVRVSRSSSDTARLEAFSDGVLAVAITLLVLEIPPPEGGDVAGQLKHLWPNYIAYVTAFLTIAVMWANHHDLFKIIDKTDRGLMLCNAFLLMTICFLPFATSVLAEHMHAAHSSDRQAALLTYGVTLFAIAVGYNVLWRYVSTRGLLRSDLPPAVVPAVTKVYLASLVIYAATPLLSFFSAWLSIVTWIGLAVFYQLFEYGAAAELDQEGAGEPVE
jgi:uncharacterized membrane protein